MPPAIFVFILGACVGSFLNVVIYRLPRQIPLLTPPSSCPSCGHQLKFFRENLPILGWLFLRGKCKYCKTPISCEYPIVEFITGSMFLLLYALCYWIPTSTPFLGEIFGQWWHVNGIYLTLPAFIALASMFSGLLAMTVIDARTYTIPIQIPIAMIVVALIVSVVQPLIQLRFTPHQPWMMPMVDWTWAGAAIGGFSGVLLSTLLLRLGVFNYSFADYEEYIKDDAPLAEYPHARREMVRELLFLLPAMIGIVVGFMIGYENGFPSLLVQSICSCLLGYLVAGGLVWAVRIFGSLAFGKEAMGLGDVHLLAAVGAVVGWFDPILIFFIAPFSGLIWAGISAILAKMGKQRREIPYGPHLAIATVIVVLAMPVVQRGWKIMMPGVAMPRDGFVEKEKLQTFIGEDDLTYESIPYSMYISPPAVGNGIEKQDVFRTKGEVL
ncbi:MAG: prepilin peptidase [Planctomycetes bacterium]|nr:prepilin peptidase [Planctomycetota bacterium]